MTSPNAATLKPLAYDIICADRAPSAAGQTPPHKIAELKVLLPLTDAHRDALAQFIGQAYRDIYGTDMADEATFSTIPMFDGAAWLAIERKIDVDKQTHRTGDCGSS